MSAGDFAARAQRLDASRARVDALPEAHAAIAREHAEALDDHLAAVLRTIVRRLREDPRGAELLYELVDEPEVAAALVKAGIMRPTVAMRALQVIDGVRPYINSHGGEIELVAIDDGIARVRLSGACSGCSASSITLRNVVSDALREAVPEITSVEEVAPTGGLPAGAIALPMVQVGGQPG